MINANMADGLNGIGGGISNFGGGVTVGRGVVNGNSATNAPGGIHNVVGSNVSLNRTEMRNNTPMNCSPTVQKCAN